MYAFISSLISVNCSLRNIFASSTVRIVMTIVRRFPLTLTLRWLAWLASTNKDMPSYVIYTLMCVDLCRFALTSVVLHTHSLICSYIDFAHIDGLWHDLTCDHMQSLRSDPPKNVLMEMRFTLRSVQLWRYIDLCVTCVYVHHDADDDDYEM